MKLKAALLVRLVAVLFMGTAALGAEIYQTNTNEGITQPGNLDPTNTHQLLSQTPETPTDAGTNCTPRPLTPSLGLLGTLGLLIGSVSVKTYVTVFSGAGLLTIFLTPIVSRIAKKIGLVDHPGTRKVHKAPIPRVGGVVFVVALLSLIIPIFFLDNIIGDAFRNVQTELVTLLAAGTFVFFIGLIDDVCSLSGPFKLLSLLVAGLAICLSGARIETINLAGWFTIEFGWWAWPVTLLWIAAVTAAINLIDGLDGLAAGIAAIVCGTIAVFAYHSDQTAMLVLMLGLLGSLTAFLVFNLHPAKIFMGDGGSMFIGFMIAAGSVVTQAKTPTLVGIALPALALGVPLIDTILAMVRRTIVDRRSIFSGDAAHFHHRLLEKGLDHRTVVFVIYGVTILAAGIGTLMLTVRMGTQIVVLAGGILFLFVVFAMAGSTRVSETLNALKNNVAIAKEKKEENGYFEGAQVRVREAESFEAWWAAICRLGKEMNFERLSLSWGNGMERRLVWRRSSSEISSPDTINVSIPIRNGGLHKNWRIDVSLLAPKSLEAAGRRVTLLGRLLDESTPVKYLFLSDKWPQMQYPEGIPPLVVDHGFGAHLDLQARGVRKIISPVYNYPRRILKKMHQFLSE